jgi:3-oxoadipate enol-lactonase
VPTTTSDGQTLDYQRQGTGRRLLFLHGSGSTVEGSALMIGVFARSFDMVVWDYRGMGRSTGPPDPYTMADCAHDAMAVLDAVGWESARVLGISFGGMVAQELAVTVPERIDRLALLCTSPGGAGGSSFPLHELEGLSDGERTVRWRRLMDTRFDEGWLASHPQDRALVEAFEARAPDPDPVVRAGNLRQLEARRGHDVWDRLPLIDCPTFIACGRFDGIAPPRNSVAMASRIRRSELHTYQGGHAFLAQDRDSIGAVTAFLDRPASTGGPGPGPVP